MKNFSKVIALVLALVMTFGLAASAATYSDVTNDAPYAEAVEILSALKILEGFPAADGKEAEFKPGDTITRAQFAAVTVRMLGLDASAKAAAGVTAFQDVPADHWASGYINIASQRQIINGYGDGNFGPDAPVQFEQAVKMIVATLGYAPAANDKGGYPGGYLTVASEEDILKNVDIVSGDASRGTVALMAFNALDVKLMDRKVYGGYVAEYEKTNATILSKYLKVLKVEGVVSDTKTTYNIDKKDADKKS